MLFVWPEQTIVWWEQTIISLGLTTRKNTETQKSLGEKTEKQPFGFIQRPIIKKNTAQDAGAV